MTTSRSLRDGLLEASPAALDIVGATSGVLAGLWYYFNPRCALGVWFSESKGWELNAFAAFGAMSGFALASLALVASLSGHERAKEVIDSSPGRFLLRTLIRSTWAWFLVALSSLIALVAGAALTRVAVVILASIACARGVVALAALYFFFKRFTVLKPSR
jgi:hypothetical protein